MSRRILITTFEREEDLLAAVRQFRRRGQRILDAYTPYPVHGLDEAMGLPPSRLTWACAALGALGAGFMFWFQEWTSAVDWPVNVGGKPLDSLPAFMPVVFESMVLAAGVGTVLVFFAISKLLPGRKPVLVAPKITDNRFAVVLEETDAAFDLNALSDIFRRHRAIDVEERVLTPGGSLAGVAASSTEAEDDEHADCGFVGSIRKRFGLANILLASALLGVIAAILAVGSSGRERNWEFLPNMVWSPAYDAYAANPHLPGGSTFQTPVPGTVSREVAPLHYEATEAGAALAGKELQNPYKPDDPAVLDRGALVFQNYCVACHGPGGQGDGPVAQRGYPPPLSLVTGNSRTMPDGELFHVITYGRRSMPPHGALLDAEDRWKAILHIRGLQSKSQPEPPAETQESQGGAEGVGSLFPGRPQTPLTSNGLPDPEKDSRPLLEPQS